MSVQIAWGITGAGHLLEETFDVMSRVVESNRVKMTTYLSSAGAQVVKMYGFWNKLKQISSGVYLQEVFIETEEGPSFPHAGRFTRGIYEALIVSPATGNTVAKIVHGIADTLVTNAIAQAQKGEVPIYIVPTDQQGGFIETTLPYRVERSECKLCKPCPVVSICRYSAVQILDGVPNISLTLCQGCGLCVASCPFGAVKYGEKIKLRPRKVDLENVEKLKGMEGITVLEHPRQIEAIIKRL